MSTAKGVDYSPGDFNHARAVIDAAARSNGGPPTTSTSSNVRVRQVGDTTIVTEHRDPYSFYWQLDQFKKKPEEPPRRIPPADYVIDEEEEMDEQLSPIFQEHCTVLSPDSHDSGVNMESHYSRPQKEEAAHRQLPAGWEKHEDPSGFSYYWHVDSGTIQRDPPPPKRPVIPEEVPLPINVAQQTIPLQIPLPPPPQEPIIEEHAFRQTTTKRRVENQDESSDTETNTDKKTSTRFMVRSLGWLEIPEEELTAERSTRAVNKAILELSSSAHRIPDTEKWGGGKELILELNDKELTLLDPENMNVVNKHTIQQIRVWGSAKTMLGTLHICDSPAKVIANNLKDICKRLMTQRRPASLHNTEFVPEKRITKESLLLTPIDEPKRNIRCHFIGVTQVPRATGIEVLNEAVDRLVNQVRPDRWVLCDVSIAPSTIVITELNGNKIAQCRVRYLSFLALDMTLDGVLSLCTRPQKISCATSFMWSPLLVPWQKLSRQPAS
uniref:WW domain-containing protein n=1 Tax=Ditylenchus dipsaci TaxID=166011 RepID=A0A915EA87_9BILA